MRISDWSSDVCSSDLAGRRAALDLVHEAGPRAGRIDGIAAGTQQEGALQRGDGAVDRAGRGEGAEVVTLAVVGAAMLGDLRDSVVGGQWDVGERIVVEQQDDVVRHQAIEGVVWI